MEFKDYYAILGIDEKADNKAIKTAYRKLARKFHPDVSKEKNAEARFKEIGEAYEALSDPEKRAEYDQLRRYGNRAGEQFQPPPGWQQSHSGANFGEFNGDFSDFFEAIFGQGHQRQQGFGQRQSAAQQGQDIELELPLFLEEIVSGGPKTVRFSITPQDALGRRQPAIEKSLNVRIPKGISDGERIRLKGQGGPGYAGGANGDLFLRIRFAPHPLFDVRDHDLILTLPLAPWEAALGARITIPTLEGKIQLTVAANSQAGQQLRVKGKGLPGRKQNGDLYAVIKLVLPTKSDEVDKKLWQQLAERHFQFNPRADWS